VQQLAETHDAQLVVVYGRPQALVAAGGSSLKSTICRHETRSRLAATAAARRPTFRRYTPTDYIRKDRLSRSDETLARSDWRAARALPTFLLVPRIPLPRKEALMSKTWLITGSSRGLGLALARAVLAGGDRLVATARNPKDLGDLVTRYGDRVRAVALDVTDAEAARAAVATAVSAFGRLDVVVNNAGYANVGSIEHMADADFRAQIDTNFFGVVNVTRAALPVLRGQRDGHIIQISSIGGRRGSPGLSAYQSAKWAVEGFSEVLAREVAPLGIRVTIAEPGGIRTDWAGSSMHVDEVRDEYKATVGAFMDGVRKSPDGARGDPAKMAQVLLRIAAMPDPPLRLLLGGDAVFLADLAAKQRAAEDAKWRSLSVTTDFDGLPEFGETPVGQMLAKVMQGG
jgi:NAD(P)-dependent dehydrogenase (short-subunit alcohol dehydrogenase family)